MKLLAILLLAFSAAVSANQCDAKREEYLRVIKEVAVAVNEESRVVGLIERAIVENNVLYISLFKTNLVAASENTAVTYLLMRSAKISYLACRG